MNEQKKKLLIIGAAIIGVVVLLVVMLLVFHALTHKKNSYSGIENKLVTAAKKYYDKNKDLLPTKGNSETVSSTTLTQAGFLDELSKLTKEGETCSADVTVTNNNDKYRYTAILDCGENYKTKTIAAHIRNKGTVTSESGLYELNGELVYRGEFPNNYIKLSNHMFRIVKITNGKLVLIANDRYEAVTWDNRYNIERKSMDGINDYTVSRIRKDFEEIEVIKDDDISMLAPQTLYIGKRAVNDIYNDGSIEQSVMLEGQYFGLLPLYDYINASIDVNCTSAATRSCSNYNYLNKYDYKWWTITGDSDNTHKVYRIDDDGEISTIIANSTAYFRPVITLVSDALYVSGEGTLENPYIVK